MPTSFGDVVDEIVAYVRETLSLDEPAAGLFNVLTSVNASQRSFIEEVKNETILLPCVVIEIGDDEADTEFGITGDLRRYPLALHVLRKWGTGGDRGNQRTIHADLKALRQGLESPGTPFTHFFVVERGTIRTGTDSRVNSELFVDAKSGIIAGTLEYVPGLQVDDAS